MAFGVILAVTAVAVLSVWGIPFLLDEYFPWRSLYKQRHGRPTVNTKSYHGRTVLITGANGAFGSRAAKIFAHREVETLVLVDVRSCQGLKEQIQTEIREQGNGKKTPNILVWEVDMMAFDGCQTLAKKAQAELKHLDHVLMTMGILAFNRRDSPEGWETCETFPLLPAAQTDPLCSSNSGQLPLHCSRRAPLASCTQVLSHEPISTSRHLLHHFRNLACLLHHGCTKSKERVISQEAKYQQGRYGTSTSVWTIQGCLALLRS